ncbi:MAG: peptidoglycan DD-metalloendopeptidase family protein, partial [Chitinophagaceae bacterium]
LFSEGQSSNEQEPRRYHIGLDIWGKVGTPLFSFADGELHSLAYNRQFGDYGATLIVRHEIDDCVFYLLYGHLSLADLASLKPGQRINKGDCIAHFGQQEENGGWPPHLHIQIIADLEGAKGDYPGVCKFSERSHYLKNCPDPDLIVQLNRYL